MATTYDADTYASQQYTELDRRLAKKRQSQERRALETLANTGGIGGGAQNARMREVEQDIGEQWHQAASDIEATRLAATEAQRQREYGTSEREATQTWQGGQSEAQRNWQTGERTGSEAAASALQAQTDAARAELQVQVDAGLMTRQEAEQEWATGERQGTQLYETGEREATQAYATVERIAGQEYATGERVSAQAFTQGLQAQAEAAAVNLQHEVDAGRMTLQQAEQEWAQVQNDLNRQLEITMQSNTITQSQWEAQFGERVADELQDDTQIFEEAMAATEHEWELANQTWQEQMWGLDAQLQLTLGGWDWNDDGLEGGAPAWVTGDYGEGETVPGGEAPASGSADTNPEVVSGAPLMSFAEWMQSGGKGGMNGYNLYRNEWAMNQGGEG